MDTATKTGIDAAKTDSKLQFRKLRKLHSGDLVGNKIAEKFSSIGKTKEKKNERQEIYIPREKRRQVIDDLRLV